MTVRANNGVIVDTNRKVSIEELNFLIKQIQDDEIKFRYQRQQRKNAADSKKKNIISRLLGGR